MSWSEDSCQDRLRAFVLQLDDHTMFSVGPCCSSEGTSIRGSRAGNSGLCSRDVRDAAITRPAPYTQARARRNSLYSRASADPASGCQS